MIKALMRQDLGQLLRDRSVSHPSRIVATKLEGRELRVRSQGWPWWSDKADTGGTQTIEFIFGGVGDGIIELLDFDPEHDALEPFSVVASADVAWAQQQGTAIYCNAPLPKPLNVYLAVHDFLASQGAFRRAWQFLNCPDNERLEPFVQITQSSTYLLGRFPPAIRNVVCSELDSQGVSYSELPTTFEKPARLLVTIGMSQFFCETAEAVFDS